MESTSNAKRRNTARLKKQGRYKEMIQSVETINGVVHTKLYAAWEKPVKFIHRTRKEQPSYIDPKEFCNWNNTALYC